MTFCKVSAKFRVSEEKANKFVFLSIKHKKIIICFDKNKKTYIFAND